MELVKEAARLKAQVCFGWVASGRIIGRCRPLDAPIDSIASHVLASDSIKPYIRIQLEPLESLSLEARQLREMAALAQEEGEEEVSQCAPSGSIDRSIHQGVSVRRVDLLLRHVPIPLCVCPMLLSNPSRVRATRIKQVLSECRDRMAELEEAAEALRRQTLLVDGPGMWTAVVLIDRTSLVAYTHPPTHSSPPNHQSQRQRTRATRSWRSRRGPAGGRAGTGSRCCWPCTHAGRRTRAFRCVQMLDAV
jgi:hypothetical protein